jgi:hypothetical protein
MSMRNGKDSLHSELDQVKLLITMTVSYFAVTIKKDFQKRIELHQVRVCGSLGLFGPKKDDMHLRLVPTHLT